jgi:hypothetical protein
MAGIGIITMRAPGIIDIKKKRRVPQYQQQRNPWMTYRI